MDCSPPGGASVGCSRQEYWSGLPCAAPGGLPDPRMETASPAALASQADSLPLSHQEALHVTTLTYVTYSHICHYIWAPDAPKYSRHNTKGEMKQDFGG